jgi:hypothetical protein
MGTVSGDGSYVDAAQATTVGALTIGSKTVGGTAQIVANNYVRQLAIGLDKFENVMVKLVATGIGYISLSQLNYHDIRLRGARVPIKYRS